jgi:hypothetical protein
MKDLGASRVAQAHGCVERMLAGLRGEGGTDDGLDGEPAGQPLAIAQHRTRAA